MSAAKVLPFKKMYRLDHKHEADLRFFWTECHAAMGIKSNCLNDMRMLALKGGKSDRAEPVRSKEQEWAKEDLELEMECRWGGKKWRSSNEGPLEPDPYPESHVIAAGRYSRVDCVLRHMMLVGNDGDVTLLYQLYGVSRANSQLGVFGDVAKIVEATPTALRLAMSSGKSAALAIESALKRGDGHVVKEAIQKEAERMCQMASEAYMASLEATR